MSVAPLRPADRTPASTPTPAASPAPTPSITGTPKPSPTPQASSKPTSSPTPSATATNQTFTPAFPTATQQGSVSLPAGTRLVLGSLTAINSLGKTQVASNGTFALKAFSDGPQFTVVVDAKGSPVLMGFLGGTTTSLDANSTAVVLGFFATACFSLATTQRAEAPALIAAASEVAPLSAAISSALKTNPDAFSTSDPAVASHVAAFVSAVLGAGNTSPSLRRLHDELAGTRGGSAFARRRAGVLVNPQTNAYGMTPLIVFPSGVQMQNTVRRAADLYIDRVSYVDANGKTQPDGAPLTAQPIPIAATNGVSGGTVQTISDLIDGNVAYAPTLSDPIALPLVAGSESTTYRLLAVGPGAFAGAESQLSTAQFSDEAAVSLKFLITDFFVPLALSIVLPLQDVDAAAGRAGTEDLIDDLVNALAASPEIASDATSGHLGDALFLVYQQVASSGSAVSTVLQKILDYAIANEGLDAENAAFEAGNAYLEVVSAGDKFAAAFDATIVASTLAASNRADEWSVVVTPDKVVLSPATTKLDGGKTVTLTATVPDAGGSDAAFAYTWMSTAKFGTLTDGLPGHTNSFTSSHASVTYTAGADEAGTDTIGVSVAYIDGGNRDAINTASATVSVSAPAASVSIAPTGCEALGFGQTLTYTATATHVPAGVTPYFGWQFGIGGPIPISSVSFSDPGGTVDRTLQETIGPSNTVTVTGVKQLPPGSGFANESIQVQLLYVNSAGTPIGPPAFVAAHAYFSYGLDCPSNS